MILPRICYPVVSNGWLLGARLIALGAITIFGVSQAVGQETPPVEASPQVDEDDPAVARVEAIQVMGGFIGQDDGMATKSEFRAFQRFSLQQEFGVHFAEINRVCELNEKQMLMLNVGMKGAISKQLAVRVKTYGDMMGDLQRFGQRGQANANDDSAVDEKEIEINTTSDIPASLIDQFGYGGYDEATAIESEFWQNIVDSTLTDEQKEKLSANSAQRVDSFHAATVQYMLSQVDRTLMLSESQSKQFAALLDKVIDVTHAEEFSPWGGDDWFGQITRIAKPQLEAFLSTEQMETWQLLISQYD